MSEAERCPVRVNEPPHYITRRCDRPTKVAIRRDAVETSVCGIHARQLERCGWRRRPVSPTPQKERE